MQQLRFDSAVTTRNHNMDILVEEYKKCLELEAEGKWEPESSRMQSSFM
jgi:hypothetical protein